MINVLIAEIFVIKTVYRNWIVFPYETDSEKETPFSRQLFVNLRLPTDEGIGFEC